MYAPDETEDLGRFISTVGHAAYAITVSLAIMFFMLFVILSLGFGIKYSATMSLAAIYSASMAIIRQPGQGAEFESNIAIKSLS